MAQGVEFVDGAKAYSSTSEDTLACCKGGKGNGGGPIDSPVDDMITGGMGSTQPSGNAPSGLGNDFVSPCEY